MEKYILNINTKLFHKSMEVLGEQVGVIESTGNNDGPEVKKYLNSVNLTEGYPYCAAGQYYCFYEAACLLNYGLDTIPIERSAMALAIYNGAKRDGKATSNINLSFGDLIVWKKPNNINGHIERIIEIIDDINIKTIGFNTSNGKSGSQREGDGVFVRERNIHNRLGDMTVAGFIGFDYVTENKKITSAQAKPYATPKELLEKIKLKYCN